jgi:methylmalonyl-CoA/ethylmalonyl-CoA epimerase
MEKNNKIVLITGANKGLGKEIGRQLGARGYTIVLTSRSEKAGEEVKKEFKALGFDVHTVTLEVTNQDNINDLAKFIEKKGEGIHHIAFAVDNIYDEMERLSKAGFQLLSSTPKKGADNKLVCFIHPKSANGVLVELCQEIK